MARSHLTCDAPGCCARRTRWQSVCDRHFAELPAAFRYRLIQTRRSRSYAPSAYRSARAAAKHWLAHLARDDRRPPSSTLISAARAAAMTARLLGEREEADV